MQPSEVVDFIQSRYPGTWKDNTIRHHLIALSVNHSSAHHHPNNQKHAFLRLLPNGAYEAIGELAPVSGPTALTERPNGRPQRGRWTRRADRMDERSAELVENFETYLRSFEARSIFGGPSVHFHLRAIQRRAKHDSVASALQDDELVELVYAMLASWGMHRMGPKGAKLVDHDDFRAGLRAQERALSALEARSIEALDDPEETAEELWSIIEDASLSATGTQVVAGTKALHHFLPKLVPPIDREYTIRFFHENKLMSMGDERAFKEIFPALAEIASSPTVTPHLAPNTRSPMNTSSTKILDNAIIGYVWTRLKDAQEEDVE